MKKITYITFILAYNKAIEGTFHNSQPDSLGGLAGNDKRNLQYLDDNKGAITMKTIDRTDLTRFFLHYCYTCQNADACETEEACIQCMENQALHYEKELPEETERLLMEYYT